MLAQHSSNANAGTTYVAALMMDILQGTDEIRDTAQAAGETGQRSNRTASVSTQLLMLSRVHLLHHPTRLCRRNRHCPHSATWTNYRRTLALQVLDRQTVEALV